MALLITLLGAILFAAIAMTIGEGLWSNTISLLLVTVAGLFGLVGGIPLGTWGLEMADQDPSFTWYFVFGGIWGVFFFSLLIMRLFADRLSQTRMRFLPILDKIGGPLMGLFVATMLTSFTAFVFWTVPISAGHWKEADASDTQISIFEYAQAPFYNVAKSFL